MNARLPGIGAVAAAVTLLLASPRDADARWKRTHASACTDSSVYHPFAVSEQYLLNPSSGFSGVYCAFPEDSTLPEPRVGRLVVHGIDSTSSFAVQARACVSFANAVGAQCDPLASSGAPAAVGRFTLSLSHASWNAATLFDYAYVHVVLPPPGFDDNGVGGVVALDPEG